MNPDGCVAVIDIGSNSVDLLITDGAGHYARLVETTRLGARVATTGVLDRAALERTLDVLVDYRALWSGVSPDRCAVVATAAARQAADAEEFLRRAEEVLGRPVVVLSGPDEGRLTFDGVVRGGADRVGRLLVADIGGGSTELTVGEGSPESTVSVPVGAVQITEQFLTGDPPAPEELADALGAVAFDLDEVAVSHPELLAADTLVGACGTVTTAAAVELGTPVYDREALNGLVLAKPTVEEVFRTLATEPLADRIHNPGLFPGREEVIVGGMLILVAIMRRWGYGGVEVSEANLADGIAGLLLDGGTLERSSDGGAPAGER